MNIINVCTYYNVNLSKASTELRNKINEEFQIDEDTIDIRMCKEDIDELEIPLESIDESSYELDLNELEMLLYDYIGKFPHYLVFGQGMKWNGASGYKFCDTINQTVFRNYEFSLEYVQKGINGIECLESSHDVPTGHPTYILGLTNEEYNSLYDEEFDVIEGFVRSRF